MADALFYDVAHFIALLSILPSLAFFVIQLETRFSGDYARYFQAIRQRADLVSLQNLKAIMFERLQQSFLKFIFLQAFVTIIFLIGMDFWVQYLRLGLLSQQVLKFALIWAMAQVAFWILLNIIFYFDFERVAALLALAYLALNAGLTLLTHQWGADYYGLGYAMATIMSLVMASGALNYIAKHLEYYVFMRQPLFVPRQKIQGNFSSSFKIDAASEIV